MTRSRISRRQTLLDPSISAHDAIWRLSRITRAPHYCSLQLLAATIGPLSFLRCCVPLVTAPALHPPRRSWSAWRLARPEHPVSRSGPGGDFGDFAGRSILPCRHASATKALANCRPYGETWPLSPPSLVPQRVDGIESGRAPGRKKRGKKRKDQRDQDDRCDFRDIHACRQPAQDVNLGIEYCPAR